MAYTSGSDIEVQSCSKNCAKTYEKLQKQFDKQRQTLNKANLEIVAYQLGLKSIEAQLIVHQRNEVVYEEKIVVLEFEVKGKGNAITGLRNQLDQNLREKEDLKTKLEQFETSSKNLNKLINSQLSAKDKTSLGYGDQLSKSDSEVLTSVFDSRSSDGDDNQANDRFKKSDRYHAVPPPLTGNYMPPLADLSFTGLDDSVYRPTANKTSVSISKGEASVTQTSNISVEIPKVDSVRTSGVLIEDWVTRNESDKQANKPRMVTQNPKVDRKDWNVLNSRILKETINTVRVNGVNTAGQIAVSTVEGNGVTVVKASAGCVCRPKMTDLNNVSKDNSRSWISKRVNYIDPQGRLNGCSRHMTGNKALLTDYQDIDGGFVAFGGSTKGGKITGISKIRTNKIDFEDVFFMKELKFNLFFVSQMCDKKNSVLFTKTKCLVLSPDFKLIDESQVLLRVPRPNNMYNFDLKNVVPSRDLTCLFAKATINESKLLHRRLGHVNFKTMNKLVKENLVRGLPSKAFENDHTCVACQKEKQHKASCKAKLVSSISQPLQMLHMDLFGPTSVRSINHKTYFLVVTDDFSREMDEFCGQKGIKREYNVARTPQQNGVAETKNRTLIEAARTMLADSLLPTIFWAEAVNTACYVLNRVLVTKPHNKTPYELIIDRPPNISFMRPFRCPVTILNTLDPLGKFDGMAKEGFLVGTVSIARLSGCKSSDDKTVDDTTNDAAGKKNVQEPASEYDQALKNVLDKLMNQEKEATKQSDAVRKEFEAQCNSQLLQEKVSRANSTNNFNIVSTPVNTANVFKGVNADSASRTFSPVRPSSGPSSVPNLPHDPLMPELEDTVEMQRTGIFGNAYDDDDLETYNSPYVAKNVGAEADFNNMESSTVNSAEHAMISCIQKQRRTNYKDFQNCLFACFLSQHEPTKITQALDDESWVEAMQEELLQFKIQKVWTLVDLPYGKKAIGTKVEAIRLFLAFASFINFPVYQMDVKSAFLYGTIEEEVYVCQPPGFVDPEFPEKVYKVEKDLYGLYQAPRAWFQMSSMGELTFFLGLQVKQKENGIFISQDKYVGEILKKFGFFSIRSASTPMETHKALTKDEDGEDVDVHLYRSMIGSLMYLTSSRPDIMFLVCACSRFQVQPKVSHLHAVKRIFRYLKGQPKLGLWYPKDSPLILEAFSDSDYTGASLDRKSTTRGCQFLDSRLIFWQCKKQTVVANSTTEAKYIAASHCCGQNPVYHSKTKHIEIRHHFIRESYEKRLIEMVKIHIDHNVSDLLTKAFDTSKTVLKPSLKKHLKLEDNGGITTLPNSEIFEQLALMGIVVSDDKEGLEDPSKQGGNNYRDDQDPLLSLVRLKGTSWIQEYIEIQEKISDDTEVVLEEEEPTKLVEDQGSGEKGEKEVSTVGAEHSTVIPEVSTAAENLVRKIKVARDAEEIVNSYKRRLTKQHKNKEKQEVVTEADLTHVIDWSDPAVLRYHAQLNRPYSVDEVRKNMVWDQIQSFAPMDFEKGKGSEKKGSRKKSSCKEKE
ncbi:ribonuclease H-like domain-containing protein [Tanacetum coccineum]